MKFTGIIFFGLILLFWYILVFHSYREQTVLIDRDTDMDGILDIYDRDIDNDGILNFKDNDADGDGINNLEDIIINARDMKGTFYEYLKGKYNNFGANLGFLVCFDIPRIAYQNAGLSIELLLKDDYTNHPEFYNSENGNNLPNTPFFFRRTRNLYSYCQANGRLFVNCKNPKPGDVIFHGRFHISIITEIHKDGTYNEIETAPWTIIAVEHKNKKWEPMDVGRIF